MEIPFLRLEMTLKHASTEDLVFEQKYDDSNALVLSVAQTIDRAAADFQRHYQ